MAAELTSGPLSDFLGERQAAQMYGQCVWQPRPDERFWSWLSRVSGGLAADPLPNYSPEALARMKHVWEEKHPQAPAASPAMKLLMGQPAELPTLPNNGPVEFYEVAPVQPRPDRQPRICVEERKSASARKALIFSGQA